MAPPPSVPWSPLNNTCSGTGTGRHTGDVTLSEMRLKQKFLRGERERFIKKKNFEVPRAARWQTFIMHDAQDEEAEFKKNGALHVGQDLLLSYCGRRLGKPIPECNQWGAIAISTNA